MNTRAAIFEVNPALPLGTLLKKYSWRFVGWTFIGAIVGIVLACVLPKQWSATVLFQVGQVGQVGLNGSDRSIIDPSKVVQRIEFPGFVEEVANSQKWANSQAIERRVKLMKKSLSAKLAKNSNLVEMAVKGYSPQEAEGNLKMVFQFLENEHALLYQPSVNNLKLELEETVVAVKSLDAERTTLIGAMEKVKNALDVDKKFSQSVLLTSMLNSNETARRLLMTRKSTLKEELSPYRTFATKAVTPLYVPEDPVFPRKDLFGVLGLMLGLLLSILWTFIRDARFRMALSERFLDADEPAMDVVRSA